MYNFIEVIISIKWWKFYYYAICITCKEHFPFCTLKSNYKSHTPSSSGNKAIKQFFIIRKLEETTPPIFHIK